MESLSQDLPLKLMVLALTVVAGVAIGVPVYRRFLGLLRDHHAAAYQALGSPTIWNRSIVKSWKMQRFLYTKASRHLGDPRLDRLSAFLRVFNPVLVLIVLAQMMWWLL
ncbi:MAG: hypothetical protein HKM89_04435 [Gemmatimonadales bacterium]|nr:hypothetical protein [Gemmatimonadales bacterium]